MTNGKPIAAFVISRAVKRTLLGKEVTATLADYGLPVFGAGTIQRQVYPRTASEGRTVFDDAAPEAIAEVRAIADELDALLAGRWAHGSQRKTA